MRKTLPLRRLLCLAFALGLAAAPACAALPGVTELRTVPEEVTDAQLAALLGARVADSDVVAFGETVHGSAPMLRMQARLVRYLVEKHGFRVIVWENPVLRSLELARWVAACASVATAAPLEVLYMPTAADRALWRWVCEFNRAHPADPIVFRGLDIWDRPWEHYSRIGALGRRIGIDAEVLEGIAARCPAYRAASWRDIAIVLGTLAGDGTVFPEADYASCRSGLTAILDAASRSGRRQRQLKDAGAVEAYELALSASTLLGWLGFYHYNWSDDILSWNARDAAQGRNLMLVMEQHGATRAIVAAHTSHVSHNRSPADWWGFGDIKSGISFFTALTGKAVFNIALTAYEASGTQGHWSLPGAANSLDRRLHDAGHRFAYFAADAPFLSAYPKWWIQNQNSPGPYESGVELVPRDHFDAYIFFDRSHVDAALPARPMWEP